MEQNNNLAEDYLNEFVLEHLDPLVKRENAENSLYNLTTGMMLCNLLSSTSASSDSSLMDNSCHKTNNFTPYYKENSLDLLQNENNHCLISSEHLTMGNSQTQTVCHSLFPINNDSEFDDTELIHLKVKELNKKLRGLPAGDVSRIKQRRRTLKNRGYAQNCRAKRVKQGRDLEIQNRSLLSVIHCMHEEITALKQERDVYKQHLNMLRARRESVCSVSSNPSSPEFYI